MDDPARGGAVFLRSGSAIDVYRGLTMRPAVAEEAIMDDYTALPASLPVPEDDGKADHLPGMVLPTLELPASDGSRVSISELGAGRTVLYLYPLTGQPGADLPRGWDAIPGARGRSTEACSFRDHFQELCRAGANAVFGVSSQDPSLSSRRIPTQRRSWSGSRLPEPRTRYREARRLGTWLSPPTAHEAGIHLQDAGAPPKEGIMLPRKKNRGAPVAAVWASTIHQPVEGQCSPVRASRS